jgi:hypothetical protein
MTIFDRVVREWWPVPAFVAVSVTAQQLLLSARYDVGGHAAGHLAGASVPFMASAVLCTLFWATPGARRQLDVLATAALWLAGAVAVMFGNLRVVDDLIAAGYSHTPTDSVPDVADHWLANTSVWCAEAAALLLIAAWRRRHHAGNRVTAAAVVVTLLVPPWMIPGAGVVVLTVAALVQRGRSGQPRGSHSKSKQMCSSVTARL